MKLQTLFKTLLLTVAVGTVALSASTAVLASNQGGNNNDSQNRVWAFWETVSGPQYSFNFGGNYDVKWGRNTGGGDYYGDFVCGTGWERGLNGCTGYVSPVGFNAGILDFHGEGAFSIYGWFKNGNIGKPDTEYYIIQASDGHGPGGDYFGSYQMDGTTYDVYHNYHSATPWDPNNPNMGISGNNSNGWEQWISVRRNNVSQGVSYSIDVYGHFQKWVGLGWNGSQWHPENFFAEKLGTEGYNFGSPYPSYGRVNATVWH